MDQPSRTAAIAFLFHGPGVRLLTSYRFSPALFRTNVRALVATVIVTLFVGWVSVAHVRAALLAFIVCHFAWSAYLSRHVYRELS